MTNPMSTSLPPIPGTLIDPLPSAAPDTLVNLDESDTVTTSALGVGFRAMTRYTESSATLLAAGTTYYSFLAMFSVIALGYGVVALVGADGTADYLTAAISEAFPGLLGDDGIDPAQLRSVGQAASLVGLVTMLYASSGAMVSVNASIHTIYGAPKDPRNFVRKRVRLMGWLLLIAPLIAFSFVAETVAYRFGRDLLTSLGFDSSTFVLAAVALSVILTFGADFLIVYLLLGRLGGIRPPTMAHIIGAAVGAAGLQLLRIPMAAILDLSVDKPQFGALAPCRSVFCSSFT